MDQVLKAVDTSGEESLRRELEAANQEKRRAERAEASARIQFQILKATHEKFKAEVLMRPPGGAYGGAATVVDAPTSNIHRPHSWHLPALLRCSRGEFLGVDIVATRLLPYLPLQDDGAGPAEVGPSDHDPRFVLETTVQLKQTDCRVLEWVPRFPVVYHDSCAFGWVVYFRMAGLFIHLVSNGSCPEHPSADQVLTAESALRRYDERHAMLLCSGEGLANPFGRGAACGLVKVSALDPTRTE
jgi:hypothetical protein